MMSALLLSLFWPLGNWGSEILSYLASDQDLDSVIWTAVLLIPRPPAWPSRAWPLFLVGRWRGRSAIPETPPLPDGGSRSRTTLRVLSLSQRLVFYVPFPASFSPPGRLCFCPDLYHHLGLLDLTLANSPLCNPTTPRILWNRDSCLRFPGENCVSPERHYNRVFK